MIPRIAHQTARSSKLSAEERKLQARLRSTLEGWEYQFWDDARNESLVAEHFPEYLAQYRAIEKGVVKADIARCMYLSVHGGFYFDTDYLLYKPISSATLDHTCVLPISRGQVGGPNSFRLGNAVMGSEPGHPFWRAFLEHIFTGGRAQGISEGEIEAVTGPEGLTEFFMDHRDRFSDIYLPPRRQFHPQVSMSGLKVDRGTDTIGGHLCWGSWRSKSGLGAAKMLVARKMRLAI